MTQKPASGTSTRLSLGLIVTVFGIIMGLQTYFRLWQFDESGLSIVSKTTPYWDFNNLWVGTKMALQGQVDWLFAPETYRTEMKSMLATNGADQEWSYPPSMLLFGVPFALLPIFPAYIAWSLFGVIALYFAVKTLDLPLLPTLAITFSPAVFYCLLYGQNGALISALLIAGLALLPRRPIVAGILIGLLTIKPQFGILLPFILIASRNWQAFAVASVTAILLFLATGFSFGFSTWSMFLSETQPLMRSIMDAPYMQPFQINAATVFMVMRALGASLAIAYGVQIVVSLMCLAYAYSIWRPQQNFDHRLRVAITLVLVFLTTPYAYTYDMVAICAAIGIFYAIKPGMKLAPLFGLVWLFPLFNHVLFLTFSFNFGGIVLIGLMFTMLANRPFRQAKITL